MLLSTIVGPLLFLSTLIQGLALSRPESLHVERQQLLQDLVTWDQNSVFVRGERIMIYSGEFHPFRLPSPGLWLDIFQKIKAMGFNGVSFYVDWALVEGQQGQVRFTGVFAFEQFFSAASEAGIYLIARPGPYINAEVSAGGMPGWTLRIPCQLRSLCQEYLDATQKYINAVSDIIIPAQITNGGPIIMVQPENEYTTWPGVNLTQFPELPQKQYMAYVEQQYRNAGIVVPFVDNDNTVRGDFAPGTGVGQVDLYGIDAYPLYYDCATSSYWPNLRFPAGWQNVHNAESPTTPFIIAEFQGGSGGGWGGVSQDYCNAFINEEAVRVMYKNNYGFGLKVFNIYMTVGGTNWGNLGYDGSVTSYDYGAAINEYGQVWREKYSEEKLEANFFKVSPAYLTAIPQNASNGTYTPTTAIQVTPLFGVLNNTNFYVVRQANFSSFADIDYTFSIPTITGNVTIPQLGGQLSLNGRDSKIHVSDYDLGGVNLVYNTADIFTWNKNSMGAVVLIIYGGAGEIHEFAVSSTLPKPTSSGSTIQSVVKSATWVVQWQVTPDAQIVTFGNILEVHLLWRNDAYNYWALELPAAEPIGNFSSPSKSSVIVKAGYLMRTASITGSVLSLTGDVNTTTTVEVISSLIEITSMTFNGQTVPCQWPGGRLSTTVEFTSPSLDLPDFSTLQWSAIETLPEIQPGYSDALWTSCTNTYTNNTQVLQTPTSLYASDYGYHTGSLIYRGHFTANADETTIFLNTTGGTGYGHSVWLNSTFLGSFVGTSGNASAESNFTLPSTLTANTPYVLTVLIDHMGATEEGPGTDAVKIPYGIINYAISSHPQSDFTWKMTGNLGGENYIDLVRGPRNEGALYAERQGYHQPSPPTASPGWITSNPITNGLDAASVMFYTTNFTLSMPLGYEIPMGVAFMNNTLTPSSPSSTHQNYRIQLFVNGWQFGKYVSNLGPQDVFPVPEGILNYRGENTLAITLWALDAGGAKVGGVALLPQMVVQTAYARPGVVESPAWSQRIGAY